MFRNYFWTIIVLATILSDCGKDDFKPDFSKGKAISVRNGIDWEAVGRGSEHKDIGFVNFSFSVYNKEGSKRQSLSFTRLPIASGVYDLITSSHENEDSLLLVRTSHLLLVADGDAIEEVYSVVENPDISHITVDDYDANTRLMKGSFKATFAIASNFPKINPNNPDTIRFEQGIFEVTIEE